MTPEDGKRIVPTRIQKLIAVRMLTSKHTQPCFYITAKALVDKIVETRRPLSKQLGVRISLNDFIIRAIALAAEQNPLLKGTFHDDYIELAEDVNVGLAVAAPKGLVVPIVKGANRKSLAEIAKTTNGLIEKAKNNKLTLDDLTGACTTLSALGMFGINSFLAIPSPGQCSIISMGKIVEQPVVIDGKIEVKKIIEFCLAADSRIISPDYGAKFLMDMVNLVSSPDKLA
ncbi:MAG: 2-oxo acid dehydrogenase subunit E2 [Planctomycetaceae bacterium]|nr:2-oxo acid dehydrogenase subunit E2 [Planctomycetaceae bacterium]